MEVKFTIPGQPKGKGRPRFTRNGRTYTPKETLEWEEYIKTCYIQQCKGYNFHNQSLRVDIVAYVTPLKKYRKAEKAAALENEFSPTSKPDVDNIQKAVLDALNEVAYDDDRYIYDIHIIKLFSDNPRMEVTIESRDELAPD